MNVALKDKNKILKLICSFVFLLSLVLFNAFYAFAQDPIYVTINGEPMEYQDVQPQITNQRAMVPIRETAEALGATVEWNKTTETMTIVKGDLVSTHQMFTNYIIVNGEKKSFDTSSINVSDRILMPVLMLSEAIGAEVTWDNDTRTVNIITDTPAIESVSLDNTEVASGERVILTIVANSNTERVKIIDTDDSTVISESTTYITNDDGTKTFSIPFSQEVTKNTYKSLKVIAGDLTSYNESASAYKVCSITITISTTDGIVSAEADNTEISRGDSVTFTIKTEEDVKKVKLVNTSTEEEIELTTYTIEDDLNIFTATITLSNRGDITFNVYPENDGEYSTSYETITISVVASGTSSIDKDATLTFHDIYLISPKTYVGEDIELRLTTSSDITKVIVYDENDKELEEVTSPLSENETDNVNTWGLTVSVYKEGRNKYTIVGYDENDETVTETLSIIGTSYNSDALQIVNILQKDSTAIMGDTVKFTIRTTSLATEIKVMDGTDTLKTITSYKKDGDIRVWEVKVTITSSNKDSLSVVAYSSTGAAVSEVLSPYISDIETPEIYDVSLESSTVSLNEYIRVTVYTNAAVSKVWIEDEDGYNVSGTKTSYDSVSGDEYEWVLKVPADEKGDRITYNVYAADANGYEVDDYFRVKVVE